MHRAQTTLPNRDRSDFDTLRTMIPYLMSYRGRALFALIFLVAAKLASVGVPFALKAIVDYFEQAPTGSMAVPVTLFLGYGALRLASSAFNELRDALFARVRHGLQRAASLKVLRHLHQQSLRFHLERRTGAVSREIDRGTRGLSSLLNYLVFSVLPIIAEFALVAGILLTGYSPWFTVITFTTVGCYVTATLLITRWRMKFRARMNALDSEAGALAVDGLFHYETVKIFGNEEYELERYGKSMAGWEDAAVKSQTSMSLLNVVQGTIIAIGVTLLMLMTGEGVASGELTIGDLVLVNALLLQLFLPLGFLGIVYSQLQHALSDMARMFELLEQEPEIREMPDAKPLALNQGEVVFSGVEFAYQPDRPILRGVDFRIPAGTKVAVIGPSGCGKSTLVRLLFRFYELGGGRIEIDGQDIRSVTQQSLRAALAIVPQDTVLFNNTLYYNIAYGDPLASKADIERVARMAHLGKFIESLPEGYETMVGERGLKLSGGEKQRVAIARALLKDPPILIFDEATSSLDANSEAAILDALENASADRTTLVIAHRLSTIVDADQILVMDEGQISEAGTHQQLLDTGGLYAALWELQQQAPEEDPTASTDIPD